MTKPEIPALAADSGCRTASLDSVTLAARVAELGEYFAMAAARGSDWQSIRALLTDTHAVREQVARTRRAVAEGAGTDIAGVAVKVAASTWQLSITSRLLSPVVGAATCFAAIPLLTPEHLLWRPSPGHAPEFAMTEVEWVHAATASEAAKTITESIIEQVLRPLNTTLRAATALSPRVMWGNVASAASGAVIVVSRSRPADRDRGRALVNALIGIEPLLGTAETCDGEFRRRNCCLFYLTGSGYCGDCVLTARRATSVQRAPD